MAIEYFVKENKLKNGGNYFALTCRNSIVKEEMLISLMADKGTTLTPTDMRAFLDLFKRTITEQLTQGRIVCLDQFIEMSPMVKAVFEAADEPFNRYKHSVKIRCKMLPKFTKQITEKAVVEKVKDQERTPFIKGV